MGTYSFLNVTATLTHISGVAVQLGQGAGSAEEGISYELADDKNAMMAGADGSVMHSLHASSAATLTIRLLKTSPTNAILQQMYNTQTSSSLLHGKNTLIIRDVARGDLATFTEVAFKKQPANSYGKDGAALEWTFDAGQSSIILGTGVPSII